MALGRRSLRPTNTLIDSGARMGLIRVDGLWSVATASPVALFAVFCAASAVVWSLLSRSRTSKSIGMLICSILIMAEHVPSCHTLNKSDLYQQHHPQNQTLLHHSKHLYRLRFQTSTSMLRSPRSTGPSDTERLMSLWASESSTGTIGSKWTRTMSVTMT